MYKEDLCYLPTRRMCDMNEKLDKSFFDTDPENIIQQELITYKKDGSRIKKISFIRTFVANKHTDVHKTEIFPSGVCDDS